MRPDRFLNGWASAVDHYRATGRLNQALAIRDSMAEAISQAPEALMAHVVMTEQPYTRVLTADHTMVNVLTNKTFSSGADFEDEDDWFAFKPGKQNSYIGAGSDRGVYAESDLPFLPGDVLVGGTPLEYPHVGVLNTMAFLTRYPSTATNRNRARARWTYKFFLGVDVERLAPRTTDPDALADTDNPTLKNPNCTVCHQVHDPVAGAFQNHDHQYGYYADEGEHTLDFSYIHPEGGAPSPYRDGDLWYRDMRPAGFSGREVGERKDSLRWLAQQIIRDPRFATGTVKFWWPAIYGSEPLYPPESSGDVDYATRLRAYEAENREIEALGQAFSQGISNRYGPWNLKDLLVEMVVSPRFRVVSLGEIPPGQEDSYAELGSTRRLTPEALQLRLEDLTGDGWLAYRNRNPLIMSQANSYFLLQPYYMLYGGLDSRTGSGRPRDMSTAMRAVAEMLGMRASLYMQSVDFVRPKSQRYLFPLVDYDAGLNQLDDVRANIRYLMERLWGQRYPLKHLEVGGGA